MHLLKSVHPYSTFTLPMIAVGLGIAFALVACNSGGGVAINTAPTAQTSSTESSSTPLAPGTPTALAQNTSAPSAQNTFVPPGPGMPRGSPPARAASTTTASPAPVIAVRIKATGNIVSSSQATLAFQVVGRVKEIKAREGDRVKAGTIIASLDNSIALDAQALSASSALDKVKAGPTSDDVTIAKAAVDRAKAALDQSQAAYDKIGGSSNPAIGATTQGLALQQAYISYQEAVARFNQAVNHPTVAELNAAIATSESAKQGAAGAKLIAPFDGTVLWVGVRVGESSSVGTAAAAVADLSHMQVLVNVDEVSAASIQVGQTVIISVDALPNKDLKGRVSRVALLGTATGNLVTIPVTIDIDPTDAPIYPGLSATVEISSNP